MDLIPCELAQIMIAENRESQMIVLREAEPPGRVLPISIGISEALAINRPVSGVEIVRPMTHDLLVSVIEQMGGRLTRIVVSDLVEDKNGFGTFYGILTVERDGEVVEIDSRPSDAIALAVRTDAPIFIDASVLDKAGLRPQGDEEE